MALMDNTAAIAARIGHMRLRGLAPSTIRVNRDHLHRLARFLHPCRLIEAAPLDLEDWARALLPLAPRTRYAELSRTHNFYVWASEQGHRPDIPSVHIPRPKVPRGLPRPISEDRLQAALSAAPPDIYAWLTLAAWEGLRCCEIATLTRDSIIESNAQPLILVTGKGSKDRVVPLHPVPLLALRAYGLPARGWVFRRRDGLPGPPSADRVSWMTNKFLHELGIPDTMHALRHRAITQVHDQGRDLLITQTFAGHASPTTTAGYAAYCPDRLVTAVMGIPAAVLA